MQELEMIRQIFSPGSRINLKYVDPGGEIKSYATLVEDLEGSYLVLHAPVADDVPVKLHESQELTLHLLDGQNEMLYVTSVFVIDIRQGKKPLLVCSKPQKIEKTSLRRYARFGIKMPFQYFFEDSEGKGYLSDISLTGCHAVITPHPRVKEGVLLHLLLNIPGVGELLLKGKVLRLEDLTALNKFGLALDYIDLSATARETLYDYIFQLQLTGEQIIDPSEESK